MEVILVHAPGPPAPRCTWPAVRGRDTGRSQRRCCDPLLRNIAVLVDEPAGFGNAQLPLIFVAGCGEAAVPLKGNRPLTAWNAMNATPMSFKLLVDCVRSGSRELSVLQEGRERRRKSKPRTQDRVRQPIAGETRFLIMQRHRRRRRQLFAERAVAGDAYDMPGRTAGRDCRGRGERRARSWRDCKRGHCTHLPGEGVVALHRLATVYAGELQHAASSGNAIGFFVIVLQACGFATYASESE